VSVPANVGESGNELERLRLENETLSGVVGVVASGPDLVHILDRVVDLLTKATDSHACFVYLPVDDKLILRAASPIYSHLVGTISFGVDEGLAGWVMRERRPAFIREGAIDDPRTIYVAELEEHRFQSMGAVPITSRAGAPIGAIVLHTVAPREFDEAIINVLSRSASLVSGAIENARLYEEARERIEELTRLSTLGPEIAAVSERSALFATAVRAMPELIGADLCRAYESGADGALSRAAAHPAVDTPAGEALDPREEAAIASLLSGGPEPEAGAALGLADCASAMAIPLSSGDQQTGVIVVAGRTAWSSSGRELMRAAAHQISLALEKIALIERLTGENVARDLFDALLADEPEAASSRAAAAGIDLERAHVVAVARGRAGLSDTAWHDSAGSLEEAIQRLSRGSACHLGSGTLRALVPVGTEGVEPARRVAVTLGIAAKELDLVIGLGESHRGAAGVRRSLLEADEAARIGASVLDNGAVVLYRDTGAYRYLIGLLDSGGPRDHLAEAVERLAAYDRERHSQLLQTLDVYLEQGRSVAAAARELWIHTNTLRQRLERIEELSQLELGNEDLLALHLAVKLARAKTGGGIELGSD
jgi:GAF domain-containing protein